MVVIAAPLAFLVAALMGVGVAEDLNKNESVKNSTVNVVPASAQDKVSQLQLPQTHQPVALAEEALPLQGGKQLNQ
ncbi:hypothetical protein [Chitinimonas sp.]|uniref:hypothetical protein n=1 Tax=Chitinimonas sp. TaxID=1934313 RepID=UPI0035B43B0A